MNSQNLPNPDAEEAIPSTMELMVQIRNYWTTTSGEPELKEFAEYVQEIIQRSNEAYELLYSR